MAADVPAERWAALLEAVADSPVRRSVKPTGLPADADEAVVQTARQLSGRVPALARLLGIDMPPPPGPARRRPGPPPSSRQGPAGTNLRRAPDRSSTPSAPSRAD